MVCTTIDKNQLASYFPCSCQVVPTRGTREGLILKFETFYLKIYNDNSENYYIIEEYQYGIELPLNINRVHINQMREYASQFR